MRRLTTIGLVAIFVIALSHFAGTPRAWSAGDMAPAPRAADRPAAAAADTVCEAPSPCPAPADSADPEVTCYEPEKVSQSNDPMLHIYGKHLAGPDSSVSHVAYRPTRMDQGGQTNDDIEVQSACHVSARLYLSQSFLFGEGDTLEFVLVREKPTLEERRQGGEGMASGWHRVLLEQ